MAAIDSRSALEHYDLITAVRHSLDHETDPDGFLHRLHGQGFMVVPVPREFEPYEPAAPEPPQAAVPNEIEAAPLPEGADTMTNDTMQWEEWLVVASRLPNYDDCSKSDLQCAFVKGMTPIKGVEFALEIPF